MARGLPDFYRGVDIAYQALAQMIVRPKYGGAIRKSDGVVVTANATTVLKWVSGKGMFYSGLIFLDHTSSQKTAFPHLTVDGQLLVDLTFENLNKFGVDAAFAYPLYLLKYNDVDFVYCVGLLGGITFEENFEITYEEQEGETPTVFYHICYALI